MGYTPFPEAVAFERSNEPFGPDATPSQKLRRMLLHGQSISALISEQVGATKSLVYVLVRTMRDWGFEVEQFEKDGETHYRLVNPAFIPEKRLVAAPRLTYAEREERKRQKAAAGKGRRHVPEGMRVHNPDSVRGQMVQRLAAGELLNNEIVREMGGDPSTLRKVIAAYEKAGYPVQQSDDGYRVNVADRGEPAPKAPRASRNGSSPSASTALARQPREVERPMQPGFGEDWMPAVDGLTPVPHLDSGLVVYLTYRDPVDGSVKIGVRNGEESWLAVVEGHVDLNAMTDAPG